MASWRARITGALETFRGRAQRTWKSGREWTWTSSNRRRRWRRTRRTVLRTRKSPYWYAYRRGPPRRRPSGTAWGWTARAGGAAGPAPRHRTFGQDEVGERVAPRPFRGPQDSIRFNRRLAASRLPVPVLLPQPIVRGRDGLIESGCDRDDSIELDVAKDHPGAEGGAQAQGPDVTDEHARGEAVEIEEPERASEQGRDDEEGAAA